MIHPKTNAHENPPIEQRLEYFILFRLQLSPCKVSTSFSNQAKTTMNLVTPLR